MSSFKNFQQDGTAGKTLSAGTTSSRVQVYSANQTVDKDIMIANEGTATVFVNLGDSSVTAVAPDNMPVLSGAAVIVKAAQFTHVAAVTASGTATVYVKTGNGS